MFLMALLAAIMLPIYIMFFHPGDSSYQSMLKVLKGLNSSTFNYLENNKEKLLVEKPIPVLMKSENDPEPSTQQFFSDCVRLNRPCAFLGLAKKWPAYTKWWNETDQGYSFFNQKFNGTLVDVYSGRISSSTNANSYDRYSFHSAYNSKTTYDDFFTKYKIMPEQYAIKEYENMTDLLLEDIILPSFYSDVSGLDTLYFYQGFNFLDKPYYIENEQILCAVHGNLHVRLVAHVFRQEIKAGNPKGSIFYEANNKMRQVYTSPFNFFAPIVPGPKTEKQSKEFPHFDQENIKLQTLDQGDCLFIPSYYFFQMLATQDTHITTAVSLRFFPNSELLKQIFFAVNAGIIN